MYTVIINDTAAKSSGVLTILRDCVSYLEANPVDTIAYHLLTVTDEFNSAAYIHVHNLPRQNWFSRIAWDNGGFQTWCRHNTIEPDLIVSLQNTSTKYFTKDRKMVPQLVYFHHPIPLIPYKWNIFIKQEFIMFLYAHFYPFFVRLNNKSTVYVVQLNYIKTCFLKKFKDISSKRVFVIRPNNPVIDVSKVEKKEMKYFTFFYPATSYSYKNHKIILQALALLKHNNPEILDRIRVIFTIKSISDIPPKYLTKVMKENQLENIVQFIGQVPYTEVLSYYKSADALLFPSKLESFGLPLLEGAFFGMPIIAADLPYAREVLENYPNKIFLSADDCTAWSKVIGNYMNLKKIDVNEEITANTWKFFFALAESRLASGLNKADKLV